MKFLCKTEFFHSGARLYTAGSVYDISSEHAKQLIDVDKKIELGALSFFTPMDEDAINYVKDRTKKRSTDEPKPPTVESITPKPPTRVELIAEAKTLGIKGADSMTVNDLKLAIEAAKKE